MTDSKQTPTSSDICTSASPKAFFNRPTLTSLYNMSLLQEAKRVAAQFEYNTDALNKGVKEFIREMGECPEVWHGKGVRDILR